MIKVETMFQKGEVVSTLRILGSLKTRNNQSELSGKYYYQDNDRGATKQQEDARERMQRDGLQ